MPDYEPEKKDLASRDVVSRRMIEHIKNGKGVTSPYGDHLWLDISILGREHVEKNLRDVQDISRTFNGIDPADEGEKGWMPVLPMQHYSMGGIRTTPKGQSHKCQRTLLPVVKLHVGICMALTDWVETLSVKPL